MNTLDSFITFFISLMLIVLSSMFFNSYFFSYKKRKTKEDILIVEKSIFTLICYIFYMIVCLFCILDDGQSKSVRENLFKLQILIYNIFITGFIIFRLFLSFEFYLTFKKPNYTFNSIIHNYKLQLWYEIILLVICFILNYPNITLFNFKYLNDKIPFYLFDLFKWFIFLIISFISLTFYLLTINIIQPIIFKTKHKLIKICKKNIFLSLLNLFFSILNGLGISYYKINGKLESDFYNYSSYLSLFLILIEYIIEIYNLTESKFCFYKLRSTLVYSLRKIIKNEKGRRKSQNLNLNSLLDENSNLSLSSSNESSISLDSIIIPGDEELIECYKNGYIFEDYIFDFYEQILNISLISIIKIYKTSKFSERAQTRNLREAFNISGTLSSNKSKSNSGYFSFNKIDCKNYQFLKNKNKDDFKDFNSVLFNIESIINDYCDLNVNISSYNNNNVINVLNFKKINIEKIIQSLLNHFNILNKFKDYSNFKSLISSNVKEEYFNHLNNFSLKTYDKEYQIHIFQNDKYSIELDTILEKYFVYITNTSNTFLPLLYGVFLITINNIKPFLILITNNTLVENRQKDTFSFWQLVRISNNKVESISSSQSLNNSYIIKNDPIFERTYEIESKKDDINHNKIVLKNYNDFIEILQKDLIILKNMNLNNFNLLMMYYEYENTQKPEKKGKISIQKKGSKVEIINIGSINDSDNSTFSIDFENQIKNDNIDNNLNDDNFLDLNNEINICSYDGTFNHFNCLCYFMFENLFDLKKNFFNNNMWDNFIPNIQKYFAEYKNKKE